MASIGLPESFAIIIDPFLAAVKVVRDAINDINRKRNNTQALVESLVQPYKTLAGHVSTICSPQGVLKGFGPNIVSFYALSAMLYSRLSAMQGDFVFLQKMGQELHDSLGSSEDAQALLDRVELVYKKLLPAAKKATAGIDAFRAKLKNLEATLHLLYEHVRRFFTAGEELSKLCFIVEEKLLAADQVKSVCARIHNALVSFHELLKGSGIYPDRPSTGSPALNIIGQRFSDVSLAVVPDLGGEISKFLLERFFKFDELQQTIQRLQRNLEGDVTKDIGFEATLQEILTPRI